MEQRIWKLYKDHHTAAKSFGMSDPKKLYILMADAIPDATWEMKRQYYERLRQTGSFNPEAPHIATRQQFAVEAKRIRKEFPKHHSHWERRDEFLYEIGPRWTLDGDPLPPPSKQGPRDL